MAEECYFKSQFECEKVVKKQDLSTLTAKRIENVIKCSKQYEDNIHEELQTNFENDRNFVVKAHRSCVDKYCHPKRVKTALKRKQTDCGEGTSGIPTKRWRRSELPQFCFKQHCLYCGEECKLTKDPKNPSRWRAAFVCRQVEKRGHKSLKEEILDKCDERKDKWASEVRVRLGGAVSDLHAADARYHVDCRAKFTSRNTTAAAIKVIQSGPGEVDKALESVIWTLDKDLSRIWNSVELYSLYAENGGTATRRLLISKLSEHYKEELLVLSSPGIATILAFKSHASKALHVISDFEDDDSDFAVTKVTKKIYQEVGEMTPDRDKYCTRLNHETASANVSSTVLNLLARLSPKLDNSLPALLIGNIITAVLTNYPTQLQIALGVLLRDSKELVKSMSDFGVTCTYDELLRFKKSAAAAAKNTELTAISDAREGLVQVVVDNFDADIASQNGKVSTHSLAVLMTQPDISPCQNDREIPRLKKTEMSSQIDYELDIMRYNGPKKPEMPLQYQKRQVLPLRVLAHMVVSQRRANEGNLSFLTDVVQHDDCPEFNGYNTRLCRENGEVLQPRTKAVYLPLIDMPPAHPDTMMTAMCKAQKMSEKAGQNFTFITADQQLYKVAVEVQWAYPDLFPRVIPRLGGMHMLMSYVGAVGTLMAESGLAEILASAFGGVGKMLTGKKFPMNMRAMRMLVEELLRDIVGQGQLKCHDDLMAVLDDLADRSRTAKTWVDIFISTNNDGLCTSRKGSHPDNIVNVVTGQLAPPSVNVDKAVDIGTRQFKEFESKLPEGFYDTISMKVETMAVMKKSIDVGDTKVYDTNLIYSRVIGLQGSSREVSLSNVLSYELSPVPTALFDDSGEMRTAKSKSELKKQIKVEVSARHALQEPSCTVIDGCALLWIPTWPSPTLTQPPIVMDFVTKFKRKVEERLRSGDVYLVFDRYVDYSTKCSTRISRGNACSRVFQLSPTSPLPSQKLALTVTQNKKQLIDMICKDLKNDTDFITKHKLVITGEDETPVEINPGGIVIQRRDMSTTHEEADNIIVQQAIKFAADEQKTVRVLADDTDVFILLLHHYQQQALTTKMVMESPIKERAVIDIPATVGKFGDIIPAMLAGHALTGCDTVGAYFGIGKGTMLKVLKRNERLPLDLIGTVDADWQDVISQATAFVATCYGQPTATSMTEARINVWTARTGRPGATSTPNLASLPPTTEAFSENVKRAHLQTSIWKGALQSSPPTLDATEFGFIKNEETKSLMPVTVPANMQLAPDNILKLIRCTCASGNPCKSSGCGCNKAKLACTVFCSCRASIECRNDQTRTAS
ncbi:hypothetical protein HOLleu_43161 [Holothuria leucospilota]|uniref:Tesmin/TSO1-like CXC domain-containing protein n=1 Tax=Holothuria leucospilota TaxID=206669 RepID=A0A9Q0YC76_HOLLE|nr:hypothetical protein HOLleu_43161 [Holothuria leucospilota]